MITCSQDESMTSSFSSTKQLETTSLDKLALLEVAEAEGFIKRMIKVLDDKHYEIPELT
jgi:hypothetical protein